MRLSRDTGGLKATEIDSLVVSLIDDELAEYNDDNEHEHIGKREIRIFGGLQPKNVASTLHDRVRVFLDWWPRIRHRLCDHGIAGHTTKNARNPRKSNGFAC